MYEKDTCARKMGIELIEMDDGFAQMSMTVSADMLNVHQTCHGGQLFTPVSYTHPTPPTKLPW
ncbi:hypothetical protein [Streptococcus suis]